MRETAYTFTSDADGLTLHARAWSPGDEAKGAVVIAHGLAEHKNRYARFAEALTAAGFAVYAHDHRGHGSSLFDADALADVGEAAWPGLVSDLVQHAKLARSEQAGKPLFLFGHSLGSFAAQFAMLGHHDLFAGVILSGSTDLVTVAELLALSDEPPSFKDYNAPFEPARTDFDWLSRDAAEVDLYVNDPLCGFDMPEALMGSLVGAAPELGDPATLGAIRKDLPLLFVSGDADPLNGELSMLQLLEGRYKDAGLTDISTQYYAGARHELLNEINRDEVTADILAWLNSKA